MSRKKWDSLDPVTLEFFRKHPDTCAAVTTTSAQKFFYLASALFLLFLLKYRWDIFIFLVCGTLMILYLSAVLLKVFAAVRTLSGHGEESVSGKEIRRLSRKKLPFYTILVPLYHEPEVAKKIVPRLAAIDWPEEKRDVLLLLESDDEQTFDALKDVTLPKGFRILQIPDAMPKTKPRACNFGLREALGEFCVIYDAEDIPDPDQLRKAYVIFQKDPEKRLACVQAKLNYYNSRQNLLTRLFTVEYTTYFDLVLGGWHRFGIPLPLGGTSNHFRTEHLKKIGGWDPFNVTEDCELGIRIYEHHWKTAVLDSNTMEEANSKLWNWLRQRSRWVKGFIQTHFAHFRNPFRTVKKLGIRGTLGCYASVGGTSLMMLTNLVYWPVTILYLVLLCNAMMHGVDIMDVIITDNARAAADPGIRIFSFTLHAWPLIYTGPGENPFLAFSSKIFFAGSILLLLSNVLLTLIHVLACVKRKFYHLIPAALLMPFYWILISFGAWKGFLQIFTKPFYWEKTLHGLDEEKAPLSLENNRKSVKLIDKPKK